MKVRILKFFLPVLATLFLAGSLANSQALAKEQTNFNFPSCQSLIGTPGDIAHYTTGLHQIIGDGLVQGSDDVYTLANGNFVQCFCPPDGSQGIQTNWLRTDEPIDSWFFTNGKQWNLGDRNYAVQNTTFPCKPSPPGVGGGGPSVGGNVSTPQCPSDRPQQVDQVWFSDQKPGQITVHWANKGDAWGFHIAYGPAQDKLIWGVETNDGKADHFTLQGLPGGDLWVSVIAKSSPECGGPGSPIVKVSTGPQVLGATGSAEKTLLYLAGFGSIALGLWQAQKGLKKGDKRD